MSFNSGYPNFEFAVELRPRNAAMGQPEAGSNSIRGIVSDCQVPIIEDEGAGASSYIDMMDGELEVGEPEANDGGSTSNMTGEGDEERVKATEQAPYGKNDYDYEGANDVDESAEQEVFSEEEGVDAPMDDTPTEEVFYLGRHKVVRIRFRVTNIQRDGSPESHLPSTTDQQTFEDEVNANVEIVLISEDGLQILVPDLMTFVPMPIDREQRKKALLAIFLFYSKFLYIENGYRMIDPDDIIPLLIAGTRDLWSPLFTKEETNHIVDTHVKDLTRGIVHRMLVVMEHWQTRPGYPALPRSRLEIERARSEEARIQRKKYFKLLLEVEQSETEHWIRHIFADFKVAMEFGGLMFEEWLDHEVEKDVLLSDLAALAEAHFFHVVIPRAELQLGGDDTIKSLLDALFYTSDADCMLQSPPSSSRWSC